MTKPIKSTMLKRISPTKSFNAQIDEIMKTYDLTLAEIYTASVAYQNDSKPI